MLQMIRSGQSIYFFLLARNVLIILVLSRQLLHVYVGYPNFARKHPKFKWSSSFCRHILCCNVLDIRMNLVNFVILSVVGREIDL